MAFGVDTSMNMATNSIALGIDRKSQSNSALIASVTTATAAAACPTSAYSNTSNFGNDIPQGANTSNLDYDATIHPEILVPGPQWELAEVDGFPGIGT